MIARRGMRCRLAVVTAAAALASGVMLAAPAMASTGTPASLASTTAAASAPQSASATTWQNRHSFTIYDRCGGTSGWIQWSGSSIQIYGEVWTGAQSCGGLGYHYVKLHFKNLVSSTTWSSANPFQGQGGVANPNQTVGYNSYVIDDSPYNVAGITVYLCSTEGTGNCNASQSF